MVNGSFLTGDQCKDLEGIMRRQSETPGVARRANAILLLDDGWSFEQVAKSLYINKDTIREWHKRYVEGGLDELTMFDWQGGKSYLSASESQGLTTSLREKLPRETGEVRAYIHQKYGKDYSHSGCIKRMHRLGFETE